MPPLIIEGHEPLPYGLRLSVFNSVAIKSRQKKVKSVVPIMPIPKTQSQGNSLTENIPLLTNLTKE